MLGAAGALFYAKDAEDFLSYLTGSVEEILGAGGGSSALARHGVVARQEEAAPLPETNPSSPPEPAAPAEDNHTRAAKPAAAVTKRAARQARQADAGGDSHRKTMELQIAKAIQNRAIDGVQVSVVGGAAFLDGRVETERQKSAAEQATRSVPDVQEVHNRIEVNQELGIRN
jgi:osmotically-inducible protein OsmY